MYLEERRKAVEIIRRFVRGEIGEEPLLNYARSLDLDSIHQLAGTLELGSDDYRKIGFQEQDLCRLLQDHLAGLVALAPLRKRVLGMAQIFSASEYQSASVFRPELWEALNLLTLVLDPRSPLATERISSYLLPIFASLARRRPVPFSAVVGRILRELPCFDFVALHPLELPLRPPGARECGEWGDSSGPEEEGRLPWSDLALLYGPPDRPPDGIPDPSTGEGVEGALSEVWFIPLSVTTRRFYREGLPLLDGEEEDAAWMHPENCKVSCLRDRHPWLAVDRFRPAFLIDPRGFVEIVLDVPVLCPEGLTFAVRLFALHNGTRAASLDGVPVEVVPG